MKISCTVSEFGRLVRGCENNSCCTECPLYELCVEGGIEQFIKADQITDDPKAKEEDYD